MNQHSTQNINQSNQNHEFIMISRYSHCITLIAISFSQMGCQIITGSTVLVCHHLTSEFLLSICHIFGSIKTGPAMVDRASCLMVIIYYAMGKDTDTVSIL